ncbi:MAG: hypothetical protein ACYS5V_07110, partial [Planctomycetota bacterium]
MAAAARNRRGRQSATISDVRLNGEAFEGYRRVDIGKPYEPSQVDHAAGTWTFQTYGYEVGDKKYFAVGPMFCKTIEGDFQIECKATDFTSTRGEFKAGLICRESLEREATVLANWSIGRWVGGHVCGPHDRGGWTVFDDAWHPISVTLASAGERKTEIAKGLIAYASWAHMIGRAEQLADAIRAGLARELKLDLSNPRPARHATDAQLAGLDKARSLALEVNPGKVLSAAREVDRVLNASGACPEAHYTAAVCGSVLACQDKYGAFHERGRYLAGPASHWLLARRLAKAARGQDTLAGAWLMFATGYPRAAMDAVRSLPAEAADTAEVRALKMFITKDFRPLTPDGAIQAAPIEQLAWVEAAQECARIDLLGAAPVQMARKARCCALLPLYRSVGVGPGHTVSAMAPGLAFARDAYDLLTCPHLPEAKRRAVAEKMCDSLGLPAGDDLEASARSIAWHVFRNGLGGQMGDALAALAELYAVAM